MPHESGDRVSAGAVEVELLHTPGHTPGSLCFRVNGRLGSGDTLFLNGCGRADLPGGDVDEMFRPLSERLGSLPGDTTVYPGHDYGGGSAEILALRQPNVYLRVRDLRSFRHMLGR